MADRPAGDESRCAASAGGPGTCSLCGRGGIDMALGGSSLCVAETRCDSSSCSLVAHVHSPETGDLLHTTVVQGDLTAVGDVSLSSDDAGGVPQLRSTSRRSPGAEHLVAPCLRAVGCGRFSSNSGSVGWIGWESSSRFPWGIHRAAAHPWVRHGGKPHLRSTHSYRPLAARRAEDWCGGSSTQPGCKSLGIIPLHGGMP